MKTLWWASLQLVASLATAADLVAPSGSELKLGESVVTFAGVPAAQAILTNRDDFVASLSAFDRSARMKLDREVTENEYLQFVARNVVAWSPEETNKIAGIIRDIAKKLETLHPPFPARILLIKTSGAEEGGECYTRANAIVLPQHEAGARAKVLEQTIIHELFHVLSRSDPALRAKLYGILGFTRINDVAYPAELRGRRITNPDGVQNGWLLTVTNQSAPVTVVPLLYATQAHYVPAQGDEFLRYVTFKLLVAQRNGDRWEAALTDLKPQLLDPQSVSGFFEQIGRNTDYIIHPDEILAVNFTLLVNGNTNVPSPRILTELKRVLANP